MVLRTLKPAFQNRQTCSPPGRKAFGKTLYGVNDAKAIEAWVQDNADELIAAQNGDAVLDLVCPLITGHVRNKAFNKFDKKDVLKEITKKWISGAPFNQLFRIADNNRCKLGKGKRPRKVKIENIIDICEGGFAYDGALLVSALCEFVESWTAKEQVIRSIVSRFSKSG